jgi:hypothetical protein
MIPAYIVGTLMVVPLGFLLLPARNTDRSASSPPVVAGLRPAMGPDLGTAKRTWRCPR